MLTSLFRWIYVTGSGISICPHLSQPNLQNVCCTTMLVNNSMKASLSFYFKGEEYEPSVTLDLDLYFQGHHDLSFIHDMLAKSINIDEYQHEYD